MVQNITTSGRPKVWWLDLQIESVGRIELEASKVRIFSPETPNSGISNIPDHVCLMLGRINLSIYYYMRAFGPKKNRKNPRDFEKRTGLYVMSPSIWALIIGIIIKANAPSVDVQSQLWKWHEVSRARKGVFVSLFAATLASSIL